MQDLLEKTTAFQNNQWIEVTHRTLHSGNEIKLTTSLHKLKESSYDKGCFKLNENDQWFVTPTDDWKVWEPKIGDYCWDSVYGFVKIIDTELQIETVFEKCKSWTIIQNLEPFIGELPTFCK